MDSDIIRNVAIQNSNNFCRTSTTKHFFILYTLHNPVGKIAKKSSLKECIFDNMALYFEYRINKNALLQTV